MPEYLKQILDAQELPGNRLSILRKARDKEIARLKTRYGFDDVLLDEVARRDVLVDPRSEGRLVALDKICAEIAIAERETYAASIR